MSAGSTEDAGHGRSRIGEIVLIVIPVLAAVIFGGWMLLRYIGPAPPSSITIATGGERGGYYAYGKRYAEILARSGITVHVKATAGSIENLNLLEAVNSGVDIALMQGGISNSRVSPNIRSLGRAFIEPLWVFYRANDTIDKISQLAGRRLAIGPEGSGTRALSLSLLEPNGITAASTDLSPLSGMQAAEALRNGQVDAVFLAMSPQSDVVKGLMSDSTLKLMTFAQAEAYARLLPFLRHVTLPMGSIDLLRNIPQKDIELVAPVAALLARKDLHPALAGLLVDALREVHSAGGLFNKAGEYPQPLDPEFDLEDNVERYYKSGPSFLKRFLPFWLATFIERMAILLVPIAGLLVPISKGAPMLYKWRIKRRLNQWYRRLRIVETAARYDTEGRHLDQYRRDVAKMAEAVGRMAIPLGFSEDYYALRSAIDLVRLQLTERASLRIRDFT